VRILQVINSLAAGGAEIFVASLAAEQSRAGHDVELFTYAGPLDSRGRQLEAMLRDTGVPHVSPRARSLLGKAAVPLHLAAHFRRFKPDVVHSHLEQADLFVAASRLFWPSRRPVFVRTIHSETPDFLPLWVQKLVAQWFDCGVACGKAPFESYMAFGRLKRQIENGIDLQSLNVTRSRREVRAGLGLSDGDTVLINIGSFGYRFGQLGKGQDLIIRALAEAGRDDIRLVFVGDGQLRVEMESLAKALAVAGQCRFIGTVPDPANYLAMADAAVMPSRFEGLSIAAIEAACAGLPLILSAIPAFAPFSSPATIFVPTDSGRVLAEALVEISKHKARYGMEARAAVAAYQARFGLGRVAQNYLGLYRELREGLNRRGEAV